MKKINLITLLVSTMVSLPVFALPVVGGSNPTSILGLNVLGGGTSIPVLNVLSVGNQNLLGSITPGLLSTANTPLSGLSPIAGDNSAINTSVLGGQNTGNGDLVGLNVLGANPSGIGSVAGVGLLNQQDTAHINLLGTPVASINSPTTTGAISINQGQTNLPLNNLTDNTNALSLPSNDLLGLGLLGGDSLANNGLLNAGVLNGMDIANNDSSLLNTGILNGNNVANNGALGVGVLNQNNSANGSLVGLGALSGNNTANNGAVGVAVLSGNNSGNGTVAGVGILNQNNSGSGTVGVGVLNGISTGNGTLGIGALNGNNTNGNAVNVGTLNGSGATGPNTGVTVGVINQQPSQTAVIPVAVQADTSRVIHMDCSTSKQKELKTYLMCHGMTTPEHK